MNESLEKLLNQAVADGRLLDSSRENILSLLESSTSEVVHSSIAELVSRGEWTELNDRFFRKLAFGTGGLRGRTIGRVVTQAEQGEPTALGRPQFPCTGTNAMNDFNIVRATLGLCDYLKDHARSVGLGKRPSIAIAHDTRHFSRDFAELAADVATKSGVDVYLFEGPRSTPELSFAVRHLDATAGIVLTASHNPPHDNGFKAYFADGAQVVEPQASEIIARVNAIASDQFEPLPEGQRGVLTPIGADVDAAYMQRLESLLLDPELVRKQADLKVVFTPIHGTGGIISVPMLERLGFSCKVVPEQAPMDGRFPTVKSPNPENAEALDLARQLAEAEGADIVIGTDPDADRMGVYVRGADGLMHLLTGNQIGSLMAWYRTRTLFEQGILTPSNAARAVIIKTLVTTDLQKAIAAKHGLRCVETLTGFKYIGAKLRKYEEAIPASLRAGYRQMDETTTRALRLEHSSFYVFGGEESYGYSGSDFVRDKDANGSVVMFAEVAAYAKSQGITLDQLLDKIYLEYGFYLERGASLVFEGADGAAKIRRLAESYATSPPAMIGGLDVSQVINYAAGEVRDIEGDILPSEKMIEFRLANGWRCNVRPSGTEPKIKYYLFASVPPGSLNPNSLAEVKSETSARLDALWRAIESDAHARLA